MRSLRLALFQYDRCPYKKRKLGHTNRHTHTEDYVETRGEVGCIQAKEKDHRETYITNSLILDF